LVLFLTISNPVFKFCDQEILGNRERNESVMEILRTPCDVKLDI
jgi:hypothetical protein